MSAELLKYCLDYEFYTQHKDDITNDFFSPELGKFYKVLKDYYVEATSSLSPAELFTLYLNYYPALTRVDKDNAKLVVENLDSIEVNVNIAKSIIKTKKLQLAYTKIAADLLNASDGKESNHERILEELQKTIAEYTTEQEDMYAPITDDIYELLNMGKIPCKWKFHLPNFKERAEGVGPGTFTIIGARPNVAKTLFVVANVFQPGGWAEQGAKVLLLGNEEFAARTKLRGVSAYVGVDMRTVTPDLPDYENKLTDIHSKYSEIAGNIKVVDVVGLSFKKLEELIKKHKPDIVIIDQLDKVKTSGDFGGKWQELGDIYIKSRELAKKYACAVIGVSQASAEAEGKKHYSYDMLAGSKTDKAAEADLIITIGKEGYAKTQGEDNGLRWANFCKNKLTGKEGHETFIIDTALSRISM